MGRSELADTEHILHKTAVCGVSSAAWRELNLHLREIYAVFIYPKHTHKHTTSRPWLKCEKLIWRSDAARETFRSSVQNSHFTALTAQIQSLTSTNLNPLSIWGCAARSSSLKACFGSSKPASFWILVLDRFVWHPAFLGLIFHSSPGAVFRRFPPIILHNKL